ncbi:hypothetical protein ARMSODRAFT_1024546 [Armillaria solidipes]|uniref:Ribonuclease H1 N-terminal domain-containing protein n=1 Tax=Armillaria solidipes TaxID=1076256 RepID=A0A2H3B1J0_9AGAR|nr:hypothetical protein ARMSODRAFT_1024546 [Armillaria solidipes]
MSQINVEQVTALLAALGLSSTSGENAALHDTHGNASAESIQGPLHSFYCYNCAFPNAIPTLVAIANRQSNTSQSGNTDSTAPATQTHGNPPAPAPTPNNAVPAAVPQSMAAQGAPTASAAGPSVAATTTTGPDGPWYIVSKGRAVGVFRGWQNVTPLVTGISRACYFCCPTQAATQAAFNEAIIGGSVEVLP